MSKMTKTQANKAADLIMNENKTHKSGHYHHGYIYLSYNTQKSEFEVKREDLSMNVYEPTISYEYLSKEQFTEYLMKYHEYDAFKAGLY
ncbi:MAG: hypothetical protein GY810_14305 [Aureispira sp.]|nr:hypothetical protein [Aureispira sp.]